MRIVHIDLSLHAILISELTLQCLINSSEEHISFCFLRLNRTIQQPRHDSCSFVFITDIPEAILCAFLSEWVQVVDLLPDLFNLIVLCNFVWRFNLHHLLESHCFAEQVDGKSNEEDQRKNLSLLENKAEDAKVSVGWLLD